MANLEMFEYPLPVVDVGLEKIYIETSGNYEGSFFIKNSGGSELEGRIMSNFRSLKFYPERFKGNNVEIIYRLNNDTCKKGDAINTSVLIKSNGGEAVVPVEVRISAPAIITKNGEKLFSLKDFMFYVKKDPVEARRMFSRKESIEWLMNIDYESMDMYEFFNKDANKARGIDNFLVFSGMKNRAEVVLLEDNIKIKIKPVKSDALTGVLPLKLKGWGFLDVKLELDGGEDIPWIKLMTHNISETDFDENGFYEASFIIYPNLIKNKAVGCRLRLIDKEEKFANINVYRERELNTRIDANSYMEEDEGKIILENNTLKDLMIEVYPKDNFLKFEGKRYLISNYAEIPFSIKLSAMQSAQHSLKKQPFIETGAVLRTVSDVKRIEKDIRIYVGNLNRI